MEDELKSRVMSWLADEGYEVQSLPPPQAAPGVTPPEWVLAVRVKGPLLVNVTIQRLRVPPRRLAVSMGVKVSEEHARALRALSERERLEVVSGVVESLLGLCPDCIVVAQPSLSNVEGFLVIKEVYDEELSRPALLRAVRLAANAFYMIVVKLNARLGPGRPPGEGQTPQTIM